MVEEIDLFEHYETLPQVVQDIISSWDEMADNKYFESDRIIEELKPHGYTCDYGLCGEPHSLQLI
jgi:dissimilatory sulfite reductase (desulfoviridin) alpha/beta subunit